MSNSTKFCFVIYGRISLILMVCRTSLHVSWQFCFEGEEKDHFYFADPLGRSIMISEDWCSRVHWAPLYWRLQHSKYLPSDWWGIDLTRDITIKHNHSIDYWKEPTDVAWHLLALCGHDRIAGQHSAGRDTQIKLENETFQRWSDGSQCWW